MKGGRCVKFFSTLPLSVWWIANCAQGGVNPSTFQTLILWSIKGEFMVTYGAFEFLLLIERKSQFIVCYLKFCTIWKIKGVFSSSFRASKGVNPSTFGGWILPLFDFRGGVFFLFSSLKGGESFHLWGVNPSSFRSVSPYAIWRIRCLKVLKLLS